MTKVFLFVSAIAAALVMTAGNLQAKPALKDVTYISEGFIAVGMAIEISDKCGSISPRTWRGMMTLNDLKNYAQGLGYTDAEIESYTKDSVEKARLEAIARGRLADLGVVAGQEQSYCTVGRAQMSAGTATGRLLR